MAQIPTHLVSDVPFKAPEKLYRGCHLVAVTEGRTILIREDGSSETLLNTDEILFLPGRTTDVILTRNTSKNIVSAHPLTKKGLDESVEIPCRSLGSAHLALDHILVLVIERRAVGFDLTHEYPIKCPLIGFPVPYEALTAVYNNYFVIWTRECRYMVDLTAGSISAIINNNIAKVLYDEPLAVDQDMIFATHNLLVTKKESGLVLFDAGGQAFFKIPSVENAIVEKITATTGSGCGFLYGDILYYLSNHFIFQEPVSREIKDLIVIIDSIPYRYDPSDSSLKYVTQNFSGNPHFSKTRVAISPVDIILSIVDEINIRTVRVGDHVRYPTATALRRWQKIGNTNLANLVTPFVYRCGQHCFVWHLEESSCICLRLCHLDINGIGTSLQCYSLKTLIENDQINAKPIWRFSGSCVCLQIDKKIFLLDGMTGRLLAAPLDVSPDVSLNAIHHYGPGIWILFSLKDTVGTFKKLYHMNIPRSRGTLVDMTPMMKDHIFTSFGCTNTGTLILHSASTSKVFCILGDGKTYYLPEKVLMISQYEGDATAIVEFEKDRSFVCNFAQNDKGTFLKKIIEVPEILLPVQTLHAGELYTVVVGKSKYGISSRGEFETWDLPQIKGVLSVFVPSQNEDTILIHNKDLVFHVSRPWDMFQTFDKLENTIVLNPGHFASGITHVSPGQGFSQKVENMVITYIL